MRIAIAGAGGVGGLLGGLLARSGTQVLVLARGAHAEGIRVRGITVNSPLGRFTARVEKVAPDPEALGPADAVIVAVKAWQVEELAQDLSPLIGPGAVVVPLENGVEAAPRLAAALGEDPVAGGIVSVLSWIDAPGAIRHVGGPPRITMGERGARPRAPSERLEALAGALRAAGAEVTVTDDIERATWEKFLFIEPWSAVAAAARAPIGIVRGVPETRDLLVRAMEEVAALARARGVALGADAVSRAIAAIDGLPPEGTTSMQRDLGAGRPSELEDQAGAVLRLARESGVAVPVHAALLPALLPQERSARGEMRFERT